MTYHTEAPSPVKRAVEPAQRPPAVEITGLTKVFRMPLTRMRRMFRRKVKPDVRALNGVDLTIGDGEIFGLVGRNGQGKTTLIKCIATLVAPTEGSVRVFGMTPHENQYRIRQSIGLVTSDERSFYGRLTGVQNLLFFARLYGLTQASIRPRIDELVGWFDFQKMIDRRFHELSAGNKQRLALMRALLIDPPLILLDEPTRSLDPLAADDLRRLVRDKLNRGEGKTILITSHNLHEVEDLCDRVGFLHAGEVKLCARMDELREQYLSGEQVLIQARAVRDEEELLRLREEIPTLRAQSTREGVLEVSFECHRGDGALNRVLHHLMLQGATIEDCQTRHDGLVEILKRLEQ